MSINFPGKVINCVIGNISSRGKNIIELEKKEKKIPGKYRWG